MTTTKRSYKGRQTIDFIMANPGKRLSLEAISKGVGGWTLSSISNVCTKMIHDSPDNMARVGAGVYVWTDPNAAAGSAGAAKPASRTERLFTVLTTKDDGSMLARDVEDEKIYVIKPFDF